MTRIRLGVVPAPATPLANQVRRVLSGTDDGRSAVTRAIARPVGSTGWFAPGDAIWTVHGSVATFVGGIRALLLQALHPLALAGVQQHSSYRADPLGRLQRTAAFIAATTYGDAGLAARTVDAVRTMHTRVRGTAPDGRPYSADDPRLLLWVHATLTDSMLSAYRRYGHDGDVDADAYVADMAVVGAAMGVADPPTSVAGLAAALDSFRPQLRGGAQAVQMRGFVLAAPLPLTLRPGYRMLASAAVDDLPPWARGLLGIGERPAALVRATGAGTDVMLRALRLALVESPARAAAEQRLGLRGAAAGY